MGADVLEMALVNEATISAVSLAFFGTSTPPPAGGVTHVAAVTPDATGGLSVIRPEHEAAPRSPVDRLALGLARARAAAVLTTAANLRAEPRLGHALHPDPGVAAELAQTTAAVRPDVYILTASGAAPSGHAVLGEDPPPVFVTTPAGEARLAEDGNLRAPAVVDPEMTPRLACERLAARYAERCLLVECGPSAARPMYENAPLVDELLLSVCAERVAPEAVGPQLFSARTAADYVGPSTRLASGWHLLRIFPKRRRGLAPGT